MGEEIEPPAEIYGFGNLLLFMVAIRAPLLADQVFDATPARRQPKYGTVNGHHLPTRALIARLITAAEFGLPPERLAESTSAMHRQEALRAMVSRAMTGKPHLFKPEWLRALADICGFSPADVKMLSDGRAEAGAEIDYEALRAAIANTRGNGHRSGTQNGAETSSARGSAMAAVSRILPRDARCFTGRAAELGELAQITPDGGPQVCAIDGMAGSGKSALAVRFAREFARGFPDGCFHVRLYGHSTDQRQASPLDALTGLLRADGVPPQAIPAQLADAALLWRERMADRRAILILDDATGPRQVLPLLPDTPGTLVLITGRRRLASLPGARFVTIGVLAPADAARMFTGLVGRADLNPGDAEVTELMRLCGHLPQAIGLLAGHLARHRAGTVADLIAPMTRPGARLALLVGEHESIAAAFDLSYRSLPPDLRRLFRRLGLHPGPDITPWDAGALGDCAPASARAQLKHLATYHLTENPAGDRFRFHDLIADHARLLAAADPAIDRAAAEFRLLDYDLYMARAADRFLARRTATGVPCIDIGPVDAPELPTREAAVTWLDANHPSLLAAVSYAVSRGYPEYAVAISASMNGYLLSQGWWNQALELHRLVLAAARTSDDKPAIAGLLSDIAGVQHRIGRIEDATANVTLALDLQRSLGDPLGEAHALRRRGAVRCTTGDYAGAEADFTAALMLYQGGNDKYCEAETLSNLGVVQYETGRLRAAAANQVAALARYEAIGSAVGQGDVLCYLAQIQADTGDYPESIVGYHRALMLYRQDREPQRMAGAYFYLGTAQRQAGDYDSAMVSLTEALDVYRQLGDLFDEAGVLNQIGMIQTALAAYDDASANLGQSMRLYDRYDRYDSDSGRAEVHNSMGELALVRHAYTEARGHFHTALTMAADNDTHIRREEARALEGIGHCLRQEADQGAAAVASLRRAQEIYEEMESPHARRIADLVSGIQAD